jgi:hypothetical protein
MLRTTTKRSVFQVVTAACLVSGFALTGLVPASASTASTGAFGTTTAASSATATDAEIEAGLKLALAQEPLSIAAGLVEEQFPDDYAYTLFKEETVHVGFKAAAPPAAVAILAKTGLPYVAVESAGFNAIEYQAAQDSVVEQTEKYVSEDRQVSVAQNPRDGVGLLEVSFLSDNPELLENPGIATADANARSTNEALITLDGPFVVGFDEEMTSPTEPMSNGRAAGTWLLDTTGEGVCTSGFVAKKNSSASVGVITAAHCPNNLRYYNENGGGEVQQLTLEGSHYGAYGDAQFMRSPVMFDPWFHYTHWDGKPVTGATNPGFDQVIYSYGRDSDKQIPSRVKDANTTVTRVSDGGLVNIGNQIKAMSTLQPGDSGGPLYTGNTALGIVSMRTGSDVWAYFTRIKSVEAALNVTVMKQ